MTDQTQGPAPDLETLLRNAQDKLKPPHIRYAPQWKRTWWRVMEWCSDEARAITGFIVGAVIIGIVGWAFVDIHDAIRADRIEHERLMAQCMADGKKEYQCVGILKSNDPPVVTVPMPIIMPVR